MSTTHLIVNADDYGLTPGVSAGIRRAHREGIVTTTTAMMIFAHVDADLQLARSETPELAIGVHLTATEYRPLRPAHTIRSLVNANGCFRSPAHYASEQGAESLASLHPEELRDEWRAQIERLLALGITIDHIDSHHHFAYIPGVPYDVFLGLAREYRIPVRQSEREPVPDDIRHPAQFVSTFYGAHANAELLLEKIGQLPVGTTELMCHPGNLDAALIAMTSYHAPRASELTALCDRRVRAAITRRAIVLTTFRRMLV